MDHSSLLRQNGPCRCARVTKLTSGFRQPALRRHPMTKTTAFRCMLPLLLTSFLASLVAFAAVLCPAAADDSKRPPPLSLTLTFDRPLEASMAPFVSASSHGLFAAEGLSVRNDFVGGSTEAIARVAAGTSEFALVDLNELIR